MMDLQQVKNELSVIFKKKKKVQTEAHNLIVQIRDSEKE